MGMYLLPWVGARHGENVPRRGRPVLSCRVMDTDTEHEQVSGVALPAGADVGSGAPDAPGSPGYGTDDDSPAVVPGDEASPDPLGEGGDPTPEPEPADLHPAPGIPTREQIRDQVRAQLAAGTISIDDVIVDMYASQYAIELMLGQFRESFASFQGSRIGRMFMARAEKEVRRRGNED